MSSPVGHPCGFCDTLLSSLHCGVCGTWWSDRNFCSSYDIPDNKGLPELYGMIEQPPPGHHVDSRLWAEWLGFDEDDRQAMEVYAAECSGWLLGEKFY